MPVNTASSIARNLLHGDHRHLFPRLGNGPRRGYRAEPTADRPSMCPGRGELSRHAELTAPRNQDVVVVTASAAATAALDPDRLR